MCFGQEGYFIDIKCKNKTQPQRKCNKILVNENHKKFRTSHCFFLHLYNDTDITVPHRTGGYSFKKNYNRCKIYNFERL